MSTIFLPNKRQTKCNTNNEKVVMTGLEILAIKLLRKSREHSLQRCYTVKFLLDHSHNQNMKYTFKHSRRNLFIPHNVINITNPLNNFSVPPTMLLDIINAFIILQHTGPISLSGNIHIIISNIPFLNIGHPYGKFRPQAHLLMRAFEWQSFLASKNHTNPEKTKDEKMWRM